MSMSKNQIVMIAIGGVTLVIVLALGYLAFDAYSTAGEAAEEIDSAASTIQRLLRADVSPDRESEIAFKKNSDIVVGWTDAAIAAASAGDRAIVKDVNEAAFKQQLVDKARELSELPGGVDGKIVKSDFTFGFPDFVTGDKIPAKDKLPLLQRQWGDITLLVETLQECGVVEIVSIAPASPVPETSAAQQEEPVRGRKDKKKKKKSAEDEKPAYSVEKYAVDFRAKPSALVKTLNALATASRFIVVDSLSFAREADTIALALGEGEKGQSAQQQGSGRRRRRRGAEEQQEAPAAAEAPAEQKVGIVTDPQTDAPFLVRMLVSTYDFGSVAGPEASEGENGSEKKEEEE